MPSAIGTEEICMHESMAQPHALCHVCSHLVNPASALLGLLQDYATLHISIAAVASAVSYFAVSQY